MSCIEGYNATGAWADNAWTSPQKETQRDSERERERDKERQRPGEIQGLESKYFGAANSNLLIYIYIYI